MIAKLERTQSNEQQNKDKHRTSTTNGKHTKQQINNNITTALERTTYVFASMSGRPFFGYFLCIAFGERGASNSVTLKPYDISGTMVK